MRGTVAVSGALGALAVPMFTVVLLTAGSPANACTSTPPATAGGMNESIIATAYTEAARRGASPRVILALFEAGLDESSFRNLANDNVPMSLAIPHDGVGNDHTSVGYLQQQVGPAGDGGGFGWGTAVQAMDPLHATDAFLDAAMPVDASLTGDAAALAQAVQRSATADGSNYRAYESQAQSLISGRASSGPGAATTAGTASAAGTAPAVSRPIGKLSPASGAYVGTYSSTSGLSTARPDRGLLPAARSPGRPQLCYPELHARLERPARQRPGQMGPRPSHLAAHLLGHTP